MKICLAGQGAFGIKHLEAMRRFPASRSSRSPAATRLRRRSGEEVRHSALDGRPRREPRAAGRGGDDPGDADADARQRRRSVHARRQARDDRNPDGRQAGGLRADRAGAEGNRPDRDGAATRAASIPSHQWVHKKIKAGELKVLQMDVQTYFFRRTNMNALGKPRSWTDHLLWHHACHTVDLFPYQTGETASQSRAACRGRCTRTSRSRWT